MKAFSSAKLREIDQLAGQKLGLSGQLLMENAGAAVARAARALAKEKQYTRIAIICGPGNNGGDGFVAARHLLSPEFDLKVFLLGNPNSISGDARLHLDILQKCPVILEPIRSPEPLLKFAAAGEILWIDAIFGTGLTRPVEGIAYHAIEVMNESGFPILAVDIPSGLHADTGEILGIAIKAEKTVSFIRPKLAFETENGIKQIGQVILDPIGIPESWIEQLSLDSSARL